MVPCYRKTSLCPFGSGAGRAFGVTRERVPCGVEVSAEVLCLQVLGCQWREEVLADTGGLLMVHRGSVCLGSPAVLSTKPPSPLGC